jgi:hypothetical protein
VVQMSRRSFLKRSVGVAGALILPELLLPERKYWQGVTLAHTEAAEAAARYVDFVTILGPAPPMTYTELYTDPPMVSRTTFHINERGHITDPYDIIQVDQEFMMVAGFTEKGIPLVIRNIGGQYSEPLPLFGPKVH